MKYPTPYSQNLNDNSRNGSSGSTTNFCPNNFTKHDMRINSIALPPFRQFCFHLIADIIETKFSCILTELIVSAF